MRTETNSKRTNQRITGGPKAGRALVTWLNEKSDDGSWLSRSRKSSKNQAERILADATIVYQELAKFRTEREFYRAAHAGVVPKAYWEAAERWKSVTTNFTHVPVTDPSSFYEGKRITWSLAEDSPLGLIGQQLDWILELIEEDALLKIRRCQHCAKWYFAQFSRQEFCSSSCRGKHHATTDAFKARRRKYMREYYRSKNSGKIKSGAGVPRDSAEPSRTELDRTAGAEFVGTPAAHSEPHNE